MRIEPRRWWGEPHRKWLWIGSSALAAALQACVGPQPPKKPVVPLLSSSLLVEAQDPAPIEISAPLPAGHPKQRVRLVFKKGPFVEGHGLPRAWIQREQEWVPFTDLSPEGKLWVLKALFPRDLWGKDGVLHRVHYPELESVWLMAALFAGHGQHYDRLLAANPKNKEKLKEGDVWAISLDLLHKDLGGTGGEAPNKRPPEDGLEEEARMEAYRALLTFSEDAQGPCATYRLRRGETLYSSVVMRYTDRVDPKDVNQLADQIARRSGISDVRAIPPGTLVKIPLRELAAPFQREGSTQLAEEREIRREIRRTQRLSAGPRLKEVCIVLDAGHGGVDPGASHNGVWESDFVYDILLRIQRRLREETDAEVHPTLIYPEWKEKPKELIHKPTKEVQILTTPPFQNDGESGSSVNVHLRWVLANDFFQQFMKRQGDPKKTLFLSIHADSLHPQARGTMMYVPAAAMVPSRFQLPASKAAHVAEWKTGAQVAFTASQRIRSEARSRQFAELLQKELHQRGLPVHANRAIRNIIKRNRKPFIPAVLRYNQAAAKVLLEVLNLANEEDAALIQDSEYRERFAQAVVKAITQYFGR